MAKISINKRIFGSDIDDSIKKKLAIKQDIAEGKSINEAISNTIAKYNISEVRESGNEIWYHPKFPYTDSWNWIKGIPMGDLGNSMWNRLPVADEIMIRMPVTGQLAIMSVIIGSVVGIPLGIISALKQDTWIDAIARFFSIFFLALPAFWEGLMILMLTVRVWRWMPPLGRNYLWEDPSANMAQLIFPALIIGFNLMAIVTRMTRSTMLEVLREDYIRTARAKGLANTVVIWRHVLKNSMIPVEILDVRTRSAPKTRKNTKI